MNLMQNLTNFAPLIVIVIIILIAVARAKKTNSTSLVLTKFYVNKDGPNNIFVSNCGFKHAPEAKFCEKCRQKLA